MASAEAVASRGAYLIRLHVPAAHEATSLARELEELGAAVEQRGAVVTTVWPASDADDVGQWDEFHFPELVFFLRSWAGLNEDRQITVLEERPVAAA
ncbi:MAG: hypothetical protein ACXVQQ_01640 [Gaiellaceae bacterium]